MLGNKDSVSGGKQRETSDGVSRESHDNRRQYDPGRKCAKSPVVVDLEEHKRHDKREQQHGSNRVAGPPGQGHDPPYVAFAEHLCLAIDHSLEYEIDQEIRRKHDSRDYKAFR